VRKVKTSLAAALAVGLLVGTSIPAAAQDEPVNPITEEEALAVTDAWFAAYDAGDVGAMLALITPDGTIAETFGQMSREEWEQLYSFKLGEGTELTAPECTTELADDASAVTVSCEYGHLPYSHRLVDAHVVPHSLTQVVTADGITSQRQRFGSPDFSSVDSAWGRWVGKREPELARLLSFGNWSTVHEAALFGTLWAKSSEEWAAWLKENGCDYNELCPRPAAAPLAVNARLSYAGQPDAGVVETLADERTRTVGETWQFRVVEASDRRLEGTMTTTLSRDTWSGQDAPELTIGAYRLENEGGAWQEVPTFDLGFIDESGHTIPRVFEGEDAYAGLLLLVDDTWTGNGFEIDGHIVEAQLPVAPQPWGAEAEPDATAEEVVAEEVIAAQEAEPEEAAAATTELRVVDVAEVGERMRDLTIESPSVGVRNVRLILPASWDEEPDAAWPVLYLLHGQGGDSTNWTVDTDIAERLATEQELDVLMVMPDAADSYYADWWNAGEGNQENAWATFHIEELPQILESEWRASDRRAVAGLSMGGFGAMSYAARYPGFFRAAASYSGVLDPLGSDWFHDYVMWGDKDEQREIWEAHDPVTLAANLEGTPLFVSWGDGTEEAGGPIVDGLEEWFAEHNETFVSRLDELGLAVTTEVGPGTHSWDTWNPAFESSLPMLVEAIEG